MQVIPFNQSASFTQSVSYVEDVVSGKKLSSNSFYTKSCEKILEDRFNYKKALLTSSCTSALEICAMIVRKYCGDRNEIIMPSFTFVSSANAFAKFGFKVVFVDVKSDMNIDVDVVKLAINSRTAAVVAVNYAGLSADLFLLSDICKESNIFFIEDNAQGIDAKYLDRYLGSFGDFSTFSFHETKNITSAGEGGAFICNNLKYLEDAKIIREKGTNREQFLQGVVDKYTWVGVGGHYLMSELQAAFLLGQIENLDTITLRRKNIFDRYYEGLLPLQKQELLVLPKLSEKNSYNGHIFYIKLPSKPNRDRLMSSLRDAGIMAVFHYIPLHDSPVGKECCSFFGKDAVTTVDSERLLRLPIFFDLKDEQVDYIISVVKKELL